MNKSNRKKPYHFAHKHPLFSGKETKGGVKWSESVYYMWWEFLKRHKGYKLTCENKGKGRYAKLYADFGDIHLVDFKKWWTESNRGAELFAEPQIPISVTAITLEEIYELPENYDTSSLLLIAVPLHLPKRFIETRIKSILKAKHTRKPGQRLHSESTAKYPISCQFSIHSLKTILSVYDLKQREPKLALWQIAQQLRITTTLDKNELQMTKTSGHTNKKQVMTSTVSRMLRKADAIIAGTAIGKFPMIK